MVDDKRLIEDYIPIESISAESRREKSIRKGHIATLHLWWARRPIVSARAAIYGALVAAPKNQSEANASTEFVKQLCAYPGQPTTIAAARQLVLAAHAERLTLETGHHVSIEDIEGSRAPRPRILDMFAGGGAIPLEALRLGCDAYALDLNPVAHLIQLCTLVFPQLYSRPDSATRGIGEDGTWTGLPSEVKHWGEWVIHSTEAEIGDLYPPIPDPSGSYSASNRQIGMGFIADEHQSKETNSGMLTPVAYLWTRTVSCKNPTCGATVPLARQLWLSEKPGKYAALQVDTDKAVDDTQRGRRVRYRVVQSANIDTLPDDPASGSRSGNVACPFCNTVVDSAYVRTQGKAGRIGVQPMAVIGVKPGKQGKVFISADEVPSASWPNEDGVRARLHVMELASASSYGGPLTPPDEVIEVNPRSMDAHIYGLTKWSDLFLPRQLLTLLTFVKFTRQAATLMEKQRYDADHIKAVSSYLALMIDRLADWNSTLCTWAPEKTGGAKIRNTFARQALPMVWDFVESAVFSEATGSARLCLEWVIKGMSEATVSSHPAEVIRGSATDTTYNDQQFDAIVTDPPYYDNVSYSNLSDFFYVWLKRSVGHFYPEHFSGALTPKKKEAIAAFYRHGNNKARSEAFYESTMAKAFAEANRVLKPGAPIVIVYAHKTTQGWATLVDALRAAGFTVTEAWPLDTEMAVRIRAAENASLASSIFIVARRREQSTVGSYELSVQPELRLIVRERVDRLWRQGVTGADLVIACVGAGMRAFTQYASVEYGNGEQVPAASFLAEVEGAVLEALLEKLFGINQVGVASVDPVTRFYVLWRYSYRFATLGAGEAIVFAYPLRVELDGPGSLSQGTHALVEKKGGKYRLRDFTERGNEKDLGLPRGDQPAPLIDVLQRVLWLVEHQPAAISEYLDNAQADIERLRVVAQVLAGQALASNDGGGGGGRSLVAARGAEAAALRKLTGNWRVLVEAHRGGFV